MDYTKIERLKKEIEEMLGHKIKGMTLRDLSYLSDDCFSSYNDSIGHRIDSLINIMKIMGHGIVQ